MVAVFSLRTVFLSAIVWRLNSVPASAETVLTVQNLRLVEDVRFTDVLPRNGTHYIDSLDDVSITMCALHCVTHLPYCSAILYNGGLGTCRLLKSHLSECLVDRTSLKTGWKLFINDKACDDQWIPYNGHCYKFEQTQSTMEEAETKCEEQNAYVVEIETVEENTWILETLLLPFFDYDESCEKPCWTWIGLSDRQKEGIYTWTHHKVNATWINWHPVEPNDFDSNEDCTTISIPLGLWFDFSCANHQSFTCEKSM